MPTSHHEAQQQPPCRSSDHNQVCKAYLHFILPPYVTQTAMLPFDPEQTPSNCIFALPVVDHHCSRQKSIRLYCVMGALHPRACRVRTVLTSAAQLGRGLQCRREGRCRTETIQVQDSDGRMIYAMLQV